MSGQPNRLPESGEHRLKGSAIDRGKPLRFRLDGVPIEGFAGDTVLSAVLASGFVGAGLQLGEPLALDERLAPPVLMRGDTPLPENALPMNRMPALDGMELQTLARATEGTVRRGLGNLARALGRSRYRLGIKLGREVLSLEPWLDLTPARADEVDLLVVGGGLAGMSAALTAARAGKRVTLVERRAWLGGNAGLFGATGEEQPPEETIALLVTEIAATEGIDVMLLSEAYSAHGGELHVGRIEMLGGRPRHRALTLSAPRMIIATGALERLPVFAGNRLPGVVGALAAYERAAHYGIWIGKRGLIATATSFPYRLATQARDAGLDIARIIDTRNRPQSRFVAFAKAYGIPLAPGMRVRQAQKATRGGGLLVAVEDILGGASQNMPTFPVDQLVASGGFQPDLTLWHMAGGDSRWDAANARLVANGGLNGVELAGSAAGYRTASACVDSGIAAATVLLGKAAPPVADPQIEEIFESADDVTPFSGDIDGRGLAYLDGGISFATFQDATERSGRRRSSGLAGEARGMKLADVAASVQLGAIPAADAAAIAQERCVTPDDIIEAGRHARPPIEPQRATGTPPAYLAGRFGEAAVVRLLRARDGRRFGVGCLVHADPDRSDPRQAIGVIFAPSADLEAGGLALIDGDAAGETLWVRDISGPVEAGIITAGDLLPAVSGNDRPPAPLADPANAATDST